MLLRRGLQLLIASINVCCARSNFLLIIIGHHALKIFVEAIWRCLLLLSFTVLVIGLQIGDIVLVLM